MFPVRRQISPHAVRLRRDMRAGCASSEFWNHDVLGNLEGVLAVVMAALVGR